jgi:cytochrome c
MQARQRYESATCAQGETVLNAGVAVVIPARNVQNEMALFNWRGGTVNRTFKTLMLVFSTAVVLRAGMLYAQDSGKKSGGSSAAVGRGKTVFQEKCSICHYDTTDQKKIGPGLKGLNKRGTFTVNGNKITEETLKSWIENGDQLMPPFKDQLEPSQLKDVIAYVKTL